MKNSNQFPSLSCEVNAKNPEARRFTNDVDKMLEQAKDASLDYNSPWGDPAEKRKFIEENIELGARNITFIFEPTRVSIQATL